MNKFKLPIIIFAAVFVISAAALVFFINKDTEKKDDEKVEAPAWIHEEGSSGRLPIVSKVVQSPTATPATTKDSDLTKNQTTAPKAEKKSESNASAVAKITKKIKHDIITDVFINNLAEYIANNYQPAGSMPFTPAAGYSSATFKGINTHFGLNLMGLMPNADNLISARKTIWETLLAPEVLTKSYSNYHGILLDIIEEKGITAEKNFAIEGRGTELRSLTAKERAEMFRVSAAPLRHASAVLTAIAQNPDLIQAMNGYIKAENRVEDANSIFQETLAESNLSQTVVSRNKTTHAGEILKDAIMVREKIKDGITDKINTFCTGPCDKPADAFYIAQWVFRRVNSDESRVDSILSGSKILSKLAGQMVKRADAIQKNI
ncbi:hypothetical protein [Maridesulfovibrio frigidus]|uniref:hypothetical protein n=1 Tax=Maridesulfovibrio frigidus TaxID=340956 RepID=UPI0004E1FF04|nr:hypothetical protein [Maridesulfovibrio frigidus]